MYSVIYLFLSFLETNTCTPVKGAEKEKESKPSVSSASNSAANDKTSNKLDAVMKHVPDTGSDVMANKVNNSLNHPKPVPEEDVAETVTNAAHNINSPNKNPKPSNPGLQPEPEEPQSVEAMKALKPSAAPAPPMPKPKTHAEWQKSNYFISYLCSQI